MTKQVEAAVLEQQNAQLVQQIENLSQNQKGLIQENQELRDAVKDAKNGKAIYSKLLAVKKDLGYVEKSQKNTGQGWMFRGIDQFLNTVKPLLDKHGVGVLPGVIQHAEPKFITNEKTGKTSKNTHIIMRYTFFAGDGSTVEVSVPAEGMAFDDKGTNKALSAAMKYALIQTFSIPTKDMEEGDLGNSTIDGSSGGATKKASIKTESKTTTEVNQRKPAAKKDFRRKPKLVAENKAGVL